MTIDLSDYGTSYCTDKDPGMVPGDTRERRIPHLNKTRCAIVLTVESLEGNHDILPQSYFSLKVITCIKSHSDKDT